MKAVMFLCFFVLYSCAHHDSKDIAQNSTALGNVKASATKIIQKQNVCFDIKLEMKGVKRTEVEASNWKLTWVDQNNESHPLSLNTRTPASTPVGGQVVAPYGAFEQWTNNFYTCADQVEAKNIKSVVLTPNEITYKEKPITLDWH
jgi:hypothetical protein